MKLILVVTFLCAIYHPAVAQQNTDFPLSNLPLRNAIVRAHQNTNTASLINYLPGVFIIRDTTSADSLFAITNGRIIALKNDNGMQYCIVRRDNSDYVYIGLICQKIFVGSDVQKGQFLGRLSQGENSLRLIVYRDKKELDFDETIALLNGICKR
jgi:hypothetical protein